MIPSSMKFSMEGATPTFEDNDGQTITAGGHVRLRIKGIRSELNQMFAIGSIREDYLGYELAPLSPSRLSCRLLTDVFFQFSVPLVGVPTIAIPQNPTFCLCSFTVASTAKFLYLVLVTASVLQSGLQRGVGDMGRERERREKITLRRGKLCLRFSCHQSRYPIGTIIVRSVFAGRHIIGWDIHSPHQSINQ
jgi:hypothetical protein